jgi:hypothetical protein
MGLAQQPNLSALIRTDLFPPNHAKPVGTVFPRGLRILDPCGQGLADSPDFVALGGAQG